jgi:hypothetical protein
MSERSFDMGKEIGISTDLKEIEPWSGVGDSIVFYTEDKLPSHGYSYGHRSILSGTGTIKVSVKNLTQNNKEEFGIDFGMPIEKGKTIVKRIMFYIKDDGTYCIYWFDGTNRSSSPSRDSSAYINKGFGSINELRINYDTNAKTFSFYINDSPQLLEKTFNNIDTGFISYRTSLRYSTITKNDPYKLEFRTTSPYNFPE